MRAVGNDFRLIHVKQGGLKGPLVPVDPYLVAVETILHSMLVFDIRADPQLAQDVPKKKPSL